MAKLLVHESAGVREFELVDVETHIGRELDNALRLSDPSISRHHATLRKGSEGYEIIDLQSSNGVLVNGTRVQVQNLQDGDRITLGQVQITFADPMSAHTEALAVTNPLGTVRMSAEEMARLQAQQHSGQLPVREEGSAHVPPVIVAPSDPALFRTTDGVRAEEAPGFLRRFLPPVPDPAQPTGERGDFVTRLLAWLIDSVPMVVLMIGLQIVTLLVAFTGIRVLVACVMPLVMLAVSFGYIYFLMWCWVKYGATPGKKIMKLRVVPEDDPHGRIPFGTAFIRALGHLLNFTIGYLLIFGQERKGVQDTLSKSVVIKVDR